jgi:hypothetical protein
MAPDPSGMSSTFNHASEPCDLVMKGGITSGVIYPQAVLALAEHYYFRNIGGTSAGAIAAAMTAAAEYGREGQSRASGNEQDQAGFAYLQNNVVTQLKTEGFIHDLFRPPAATRPLLDGLLAYRRRQRARTEHAARSKHSEPYAHTGSWWSNVRDILATLAETSLNAPSGPFKLSVILGLAVGLLIAAALVAAAALAGSIYPVVLLLSIAVVAVLLG